MTAQRRPTGSLKDLVLEVLRTGPRPMTGLEVFDRLHEQGVSRFLSQTYRALSELRLGGAVRRVEVANKFAIGAENILMNLVCEACGVIECAPAAQAIQSLAQHAEARDFKPGRYVVEVVGRCSACAGADGYEAPQTASSTAPPIVPRCVGTIAAAEPVGVP